MTDLAELSEAVQRCTNCDLHRHATQAVFGEGPVGALLMAVGEQPGDREDREGVPFVGPAGSLLNKAFVDAGIDRAQVYLTNAVKHFKWEPRGARRIHKTPDLGEVQACHPWLEQELAIVKPRLVLAMGAVAARALVGPSVRVTRDRATVITGDGRPPVIPTLHPSSVLRAPDRPAAYAAFVADLVVVAKWLDTDVDAT